MGGPPKLQRATDAAVGPRAVGGAWRQGDGIGYGGDTILVSILALSVSLSIYIHIQIED